MDFRKIKIGYGKEKLVKLRKIIVILTEHQVLKTNLKDNKAF